MLGLVTGLTLSHEVFVDWGWLIGPAAWFLAAALTAKVTGLSLRPALLGALLAGVPSAALTALGAHWQGALVAVILFGVWCGRSGARTAVD